MNTFVVSSQHQVFSEAIEYFHGAVSVDLGAQQERTLRTIVLLSQKKKDSLKVGTEQLGQFKYILNQTEQLKQQVQDEED